MSEDITVAEMDERIKQFEERQEARKQALINQTMAHPVLGHILSGGGNFIADKVINDFITCADDFCRDCKAHRGWVDDYHARTEQEGLYKGFRLKVARSGGLGTGLVRPLAQALIEGGRLSDDGFQFVVLGPLFLAYRVHSYNVYRMGHHMFAPISKQRLDAVDAANSEIATFTDRTMSARPDLLGRNAVMFEVAQRCAYSAPGRVTKYHAKLAHLVMRSPLAGEYLYQMSQLYAMSENVLIDENWGGNKELSTALEIRYGAQALMKECPDCCFWSSGNNSSDRKVPEEYHKKLYGVSLGRSGMNIVPDPN